MSIIPVGYAELAIHWQRSGDVDDYVNVWGLANEGPFTVDAIASKAALSLASIWTAGSMSSGMRLDRVVVKLAVEGDVPVTSEANIGIDGTFSEQLLPQNCAVLIHKLTARGGRRGRGRSYHPWLAEGGVDSVGIIGSGTRGGLTGKFNAWLADMNAKDIPLCLLHNQPKTGTLPAPDVIIGCICDAIIATQRRRLRK